MLNIHKFKRVQTARSRRVGVIVERVIKISTLMTDYHNGSGPILNSVQENAAGNVWDEVQNGK